MSKHVGITRESYLALSAYEQGYVSYMQGAFNDAVDDKCPYDKGSDECELWHQGEFAAIAHVQDSEE